MASVDNTFAERQHNIAEALISQMRAIKEENIVLRKERDALASGKDEQTRENKALTEEIETLRIHRAENEKLQEKISKLETALEDTKNSWKQSLEGIADGLGIDVLTLLPEPELASPIFGAISPVESIISDEAVLPTLKILEGLGCDQHGKIWDKDFKLIGKIDAPLGKKGLVVKCWKRKLVCNRNGELLYNGMILARARLVTTEETDGVEVEAWPEVLPVPVETSGVVVF